MGFTFFILSCSLRVFDLSNPSYVVRSEKRDNKWSFISMTSASERLRSSEESHLDSSSKLNYTMEWNIFRRRNLFFFYLCILKVHIIWEGLKILQYLHHRFDHYYIGQIFCGDFAKICGHLRIYELYISCKLRGIEYGFMKISLKRWTMNLIKCSLRNYFANRFAFCCMYNIVLSTSVCSIGGA